MASDILHIKDSFYFEVPKSLYHPHYETLEDVPHFLRKLHKDDFALNDELNGVDAEALSENLVHQHKLHEGETLSQEQADEYVLKEYEHQLAGKIIIPQPFGAELRSLYEKVPGSGFAVSKFMILELVVAGLLIVLFTWMKKKMLSEHPTKGRFANTIEVIMYYVRDQIAKKAIGHDADKFVPLLWTVFFFILGCNLFGMLPWMGTATGTWGTTVALALAMLICTIYSGLKTFGPKWLWSGFVPHMDLPWWLSPIKLLIFVLEFAGMIVKHAVLSIRLLANMAAGHMVLLGLFALALAAAESPLGSFYVTAIPVVVGATLMSILELGVAVLQAYVFTLLSALFIGMAVHEH